ncbi:MAG TPA: hypothetical protein GXZ36_03840 [Firmicutes bacterium]|nr:hypothetical protein [Bacillota bacterium]
MGKKLVLSVLTTLFLIITTAAPGLSYIGWENCVWLSVNQNQEYHRMGYFHQDDILTKVFSEYKEGGKPSFDISLSNTIMEFERHSGLYGEIGLNSRDGLNILIGGGYTYIDQRADFFLTLGPKYYIQDEILVVGVEVFYRILPPFVINLGYDDYTEAIFVGLGLAYR